MDRKLVTIRNIDSIDPIEGADRIEVAHVGGWNVVVAKTSGFKAGDKAVFFEIDSLLNKEHPAFADVAKRGVKTMTKADGTSMTGHVLRTAKLRGVFSQGMLVPLSEFNLTGDETQDQVDEVFADLVTKWEPPVPAGIDAKGTFPSHIRKTDAERVQNVTDEFVAGLNPDEWFATEKIDGTSATFWKDEDGEFHAASRNLEVELVPGSMHSLIADKFGLRGLLGPGEWIQGEIFGEGIQGNKLKLNEKTFRAFNSSRGADNIPDDLKVPALDWTFPGSVSEAIDQVTGMKSTINPKVQAEGVVWWNREGTTFRNLGERPNFKSINPSFLAKHGE